jgi:anti-sigma28 factor (negative regulator of flagellin synthesis)
MNIKRTDLNTKLNLYETSKREKDILKNNAEPAKAAANKAEVHDKITISQEAKNLNILDFVNAKIKNEIEGDLSDAGIKNAERLNALKAQIKSGEYITSSIDIAAAIIGGGSI